MSSETPEQHFHARFDPLCLVMGWLVPGLGYFRIGQRRRGTLVMSGVLSMVFIGVLVGGVHVVDRQEESLWFLPQMLAGPVAFLVDYLNETIVKTGRFGTPSIGRVHEIGMLYVALAGLMNLATMLDSATRPIIDVMPERPGGEQRRADDPRLVERRAQQRSEAEGTTNPDSHAAAPGAEERLATSRPSAAPGRST